MRNVVFTGLLLFCCSLSNAANSQLEDLMQRFFDWRLDEAPEYGTMFGFHTRDDRVEEFTEQAFDRQLSKAQEFLNEAAAIDVNSLSYKDKINLDVLVDTINTFVDGHRYRHYSTYNVINPLEKLTVEWRHLVQKMKFETESDYRKLIARLRLLPVQVDQQIQLMRYAIANGTTLHAYSLTGVVESLNESIVDNTTVTSSPLYTPLLHVANVTNHTTAQQLEEETKQVLLNEVNGAWQRFRDFITNEYSQQTRSGVGVSSLPGGREFYDACLRWHTTTTLTAEQIHQRGLDEVDRIQPEMQKIMDAEGFTGSVREFVERIFAQPENFYNTSEELLHGYEMIIKDVDKELDRVLINNPDFPVIVRAFDNPDGSGGRYSQPPLDGSSPGVFFANVFHPETEPKLNMVALTLHEVAPGHHTQLSYAQVADSPVFRRATDYRKLMAIPFNWPFYTAYIEGWALYAESLGEGMGVYPDRLSLFGRYASEMFRACRLVVDTGIHAFGWSKERGVEYFKNYTTRSDNRLDNELNRYISWPGQACPYKVGQLKLQELRTKAQQELGTLFDLRKFHEEVLNLGTAPLSIVESHVDRWISDTLEPPQPPVSGTVQFQPSAFLLDICLVTVAVVMGRNAVFHAYRLY